MTKILLKMLCGISIIIVFFLSIIAVFLKVMQYNPLENIPNESIDIPSYISYGFVTYENDYINMRQLLNLDEESDIKEVFVIKEENAYLVYTDEKKSRSWIIASVNLRTGDFEECCIFNNPRESYLVRSGKRYEERNGYYLDGQIVLNDGQNVLVYDIDSKGKWQYTYEEYDFPECKVYCEYIDGESIRIILNGEEKVWTLESMAENSDSIAQICKLKDKVTWDKETSYVQYFFTEQTIQYIENRIYLVGRCLNYHGSSFAVILEYDAELNEWMYVSNYYTGDIFQGEFYLIPEYSS